MNESENIKNPDTFDQNGMKDRWKNIDFGVITTFLRLILKNVSEKTCGIVTILTSTALSIADTVSDIVVAFSLFSSSHYYWGCIVAIADYISPWQILFHNCFSNHWRNAASFREKIMTLLFLVMSPFSTALFNLRWLFKFETADQPCFDYLHHNARMTSLLSGSFESPLQIIFLLVLWGTAKLSSPLDDNTTIIDSRGRTLYVGILPGVISLMLSALSLIKGSLEVSEARTSYDKLNTVVYGTTNFFFRLPTIAFAILYFDEWVLIPVIVVLLANFVLVKRYDEKNRKAFSVATSVVIACLTPFVSSDEANIYQRNDLKTSESENKAGIIHRKQLSAKLSMMTTPLLLLIDITLYLLLKFDKSFKYNENIILERATSEKLLSTFMFPMAGLSLVSNYLYGLKISEKRKKIKFALHFSGLIILLIGGVVISGFGTLTIYRNNASSINSTKSSTDSTPIDITSEIVLSYTSTTSFAVTSEIVENPTGNKIYLHMVNN